MRVDRLRGTVVAVAVAALATLLPAAPASPAPSAAPPAQVVLKWNDLALKAVVDGTIGPPMVARALAMLNTCMYDAWAAYDPLAAGTMLGGSLRRPPTEFTAANKVEAVSYGAFRAAMDLFAWDAPIFVAYFRQLGFDPSNHTTDTTTPAGVGNVACAALLDFRHHDGSNQLGDLAPGPYSDYTGYVPRNEPMRMSHYDRSTVLDPNRWQQLTYRTQDGVLVTPGFVGAQWLNVTPFALTSPSQFRNPIGPAQFPSADYEQQARDLVELSAGLTDRQKVIAEYWADYAGTVQPPGHWDQIAQWVAERDGYTLDDQVKLLFVVTNALMDAGIGSWDDKRFYDSVRPATSIRFLFAGSDIRSWAGPGQGTRTIDGSRWQPYQPAWFPTPPFPEYASGHSTFSAAAATALASYTGSDTYGGSATVGAGDSFVEPGVTPSHDITLRWATFTEAADQAGMSRRYGGIHFERGDLDGRLLGRQVGTVVFLKAQQLFLGLP